MIISYGGLYFEAGYGRMLPVTDIKRSMGVDTESQDQERSKPATLIKGCKLETFSFGCTLLRLFRPSPESIIKKLEDLIGRKQPKKLLLGGRSVGKYKWLLVGVEVDYKTVDNFGGIIEAGISLNFEEFVKAGTKVKEAAKGTAAPGVAKGTVSVNDAYKAAAPSTEDKAARKHPGGPQQQI